MRASVECLLAGLPIVSVPSIGGRELLFSPDTALIVEPRREGVRVGVEAMLVRGLGRDEVRRATLGRVREERQRFLDAANRQIASELYLSFDTIKTHVRKVFGKLGVSNRTQAAIAARDHGLDLAR